jgi:HSP20 family protein
MSMIPYQTSSGPLESLVEAMLAPLDREQSRGGGLMRGPATDVMETQNEIRVVTELPGFSSDNVEVDLENNVLTIRGEKREEREEGGEKNSWHLTERRFGKFSRSFVLPREIEQEKIEARFENGVLTVSIPKSEKAKRRRIGIANGGRENQVGEISPPGEGN